MFRTLRVSAIPVLLSPALLLAYSSGPPPRVTGAPGDQTCLSCHSGAPLNAGGGHVTLTSSGGSTYTPGQAQTLTLTIADAQAAVYGFQITARAVADQGRTQAGSFTPGPSQLVLCENNSGRLGAQCPSNAPAEFIEHSEPFNTGTITVTWTPPPASLGPVTIYAAANAANGDFRNSGDHIYTTLLQLAPATIVPKPTIQDGGVVSATAFQPGGIAPGTWIEIYGSDLASNTRSWQTGDFKGTAAPTSLDGVSVTIGGKNAYVAFISPGQVNAQVPDGIPMGSGIPLVLANDNGQSSPFLLQTVEVAPALLAPPSFRANGKQYVAALFNTQGSNQVVFAGPSGAIAGVSTRPASAGEVITLYGIGFGSVTPSVTAGTIATEATALAGAVSIFCGQTPVKVLYAGLAPGLVGLYQFNVEVPATTPGDAPITVQVGDRVVDGHAYLTTSQ
jgi:uncharacterized protein (TIGR03437 family)